MDLQAEVNYRQRLIGELISRQKKNPSYSLRSFARDLQISPTALSQVLNKKRKLSKASLLKVADRLSFTPSETFRALAEGKSDSSTFGDDQFRLLSDDVFRFMSEWYYFALLSLASTGKAKSNIQWISRRFGITILESEEALARLKRLGLIEVKQGYIVHNGQQLRTTTDIPSAAARALQKGHLRLATESIENDPIHLRDMTSMTMAIKCEKIIEAKKMIKQFRRRFCKTIESKSGEEVYVMGIQFFPVTKSGIK